MIIRRLAPLLAVPILFAGCTQVTSGHVEPVGASQARQLYVQIITPVHDDWGLLDLHMQTSGGEIDPGTCGHLATDLQAAGQQIAGVDWPAVAQASARVVINAFRDAQSAFIECVDGQISSGDDLGSVSNEVANANTEMRVALGLPPN